MWHENTSQIECGVVAWVKTYMLRWFDHIGRNKSEEFVKKVYVSESEAS